MAVIAMGSGKLGKITFAQRVYNHPVVKQHFGEVKAWVTFSTEFDLPTKKRRIMGNVWGCRIDGKVDEHGLLSKLKVALKGKKFLVLDDVWNEDRHEWNTLKSVSNLESMEARLL